MRRREVITLLGGAAAWPLAARAQQPAMQVVGFLRSTRPEGFENLTEAVRAGLREGGYDVGRNVAIEYHWGNEERDRLPVLATELIRRPVAVIVCDGRAAVSAKAATATVPIVFVTGSNPVRDGLVTSFNRPGANLTGISFVSGESGGKRLELLRQLVPGAATIGVMIDPHTNEGVVEQRDLEVAAKAIGQQLFVIETTADRESLLTMPLSRHTNRRAFIVGLGGAVVWPLAARAQQTERMRRIAVLHTGVADDAHAQARNTRFLQGLQALGWTDGRNVRIDIRWGMPDADRVRRYVADIGTVTPDVILATGGAVVGPLLQATRSIPVVFTLVPDPVGAGFVNSLAQPGGNATGFMLFEYGVGGKYLELLKELASGVTRVAVVKDPAVTAGIGQFGAMQAVAPLMGLQASPVNVRDASEIEHAVAAFARTANGSLVVAGSPLTFRHRDLIIALAARHKLPAVYYERQFVADGGLISYGPDFVEQYRLAAGYVDRILKGEKPADLPVQAPTKHQLVINLKTAKALGLDIPPTLLARADEVIE